MSLLKSLLEPNVIIKKKIIKVSAKALSDVKPITSGGWVGNNSLFRNLGGDYNQANYSELLRQEQGLHARCIRIIADNVAKCKLIVKKYENQSESTEPDYHILQDLFRGKNKPNPRQTQYELYHKTVRGVLNLGKYYWRIVRNPTSKLPVQIYSLTVTSNDQMTAKYDTAGNIDHWVYRYNSKEISFQPEDIIDFGYDSLYDDIYGIGLTQQGSWIFDKLNELNNYQLRYYQNDAMKKMIIKSDRNTSEMELAKFKEDFAKSNQGSSNAGKTLFLNTGMDVVPNSNNPQESDYNKTYDLLQDEICSLDGVPPSIASRVKDTNRANGVAAEGNFFNFTLSPIVKMMDSKLTRMLQNNYKDSDNYFVEHRLELPKDRERELNEFKFLAEIGALKYNQALKWAGFDMIPNGEDFVNVGGKIVLNDKPNPAKPEDQQMG